MSTQQHQSAHLCTFDDLPKVDGMPHGCAWGYYKDHQKGALAAVGGDSKDQEEGADNLGRLNLLTASHVAEVASTEIRTGIRIQLDWGLNNVQFAGFGRKTLDHKVLDSKRYGEEGGWIGCDDEVHFNTQCSSQWDGFRHVAHRLTGKYYGGVEHEDVVSGKTTRNGIDSWCKTGGIASRGVLLDWVRWHEQTRPGQPLPSPVTRHEIPLSEIKAVAEYQGTTFQPGDILLIRSGFVRWHNGADETERKKGTFDKAEFIGLHATNESVRWLWDNHFSAVGGDTVAFEAWPPTLGKGEGTECLHEWLLSMWGCPIGEMWDLETLSKVCEEQKRWSFFLTSAPLNVPGGVGSPPNVMAIF